MLKVLMIERLSRRAVIRRVVAAGLASLLQAGVSAAPANAWNKIRKTTVIGQYCPGG